MAPRLKADARSHQGKLTKEDALSILFYPPMHGRFSDPYLKVLWEGVKLHFWFFFFIWASETKSFERSIIFRYGLPLYILRKGQKTKARWGVQCPAPFILGLSGRRVNFACKHCTLYKRPISNPHHNVVSPMHLYFYKKKFGFAPSHLSLFF